MLILVFAVLGLMVTAQFRTEQRLAEVLPYRRVEELAAALKTAESERDLLRQEVGLLRSQLADTLASESAMWMALDDELRKLRIMAGVEEVTGPGVLVVMEDSTRPSTWSEDPNAYLIHDDDVLKVVNELRASGAEAISINGQRLTSLSEIRCTGPTISINGTRVAPPLTILAIGDPHTLETGLRMRGGVADQLGLWGIEVRIKREDVLVIPAFAGALTWQYARVVGGAKQ